MPRAGGISANISANIPAPDYHVPSISANISARICAPAWQVHGDSGTPRAATVAISAVLAIACALPFSQVITATITSLMRSPIAAIAMTIINVHHPRARPLSS